MKVIIVDDDRIILKLHQKLVVDSQLSDEPITFITAIEALAYLVSERSADGPYLLLLDINMPDMNGWQLLDKIETLQINSKMSVVICSSSVNQPDKDKASSYKNVVAFIEKPLMKADILKFKSYARVID